MKRKTLVLSVFSTVCSALILTACGSGSSGGSTPTPTPTASPSPSPTVSPSPAPTMSPVPSPTPTSHNFALFLNTDSSSYSVVQCKTNSQGQVESSTCSNKPISNLSSATSITVGGNTAYIGNTYESSNNNYYAYIVSCTLSPESGLLANTCKMSESTGLISGGIASFRQLAYANNMLYSATGSNPTKQASNGQLFYCLTESLPTLNCGIISTPSAYDYYPYGVAINGNTLYYSNNSHSSTTNPTVVSCPMTTTTTLNTTACSAGGQSLAVGNWLGSIAINSNNLYLSNYSDSALYVFNAQNLSSAPITYPLGANNNAYSFGFSASTGYIILGNSSYVQCPANQMGSANSCNLVNLNSIPALNIPLVVNSLAFY